MTKEAANSLPMIINGKMLDLDAGTFRDEAGADIALRPQSFAVLKMLADHPDRIVSKDELMQAIWPGIAVTENSLVQCIHELRRALGDRDQTIVRTAAKRGYRLILPSAGTTEGMVSAVDPIRSTRYLGRHRGRRHGLSLLLAAVLLFLAGAATFFGLRPQQGAADGPPSIAVLPFADLSDNGEYRYLVDGFTDDLTTELARVSSLFVVSRKAAFAYRDKDARPDEIAAALGGSGHLWAERFDGRWTNVFALQDQVVASIAGALKLRLAASHAMADIAGGTLDVHAYEAFLLGQEKERRNRPSDIVAAVAHYEKALALDRDFGMAAAALAWVYWNADDQRAKALGLSWPEIEDKIYDSLNLAGRNPSAPYYQLLAELLVREKRSGEAVEALQKAVALDPSHPWTYEGLSQALNFAGRTAEARTYLKAAMRVDPGWSDWRYYQDGLSSFVESRFEDSIMSLEKIDFESPDPWTKFYGLQVLLAAYGHLGHEAGIAMTLKRLDAVLAERNEGAPDHLLARQFFVFEHEADIDRLLQGLTGAGVTELREGSYPSSEYRLSGDEIRALLLGRKWQGRSTSPEVEPYRVVVSEDGSIAKTIGARSANGRVLVQDDLMCSAYPRLLFYCGAVFRNSSGSASEQNEYMLVQRTGRFEFSVED